MEQRQGREYLREALRKSLVEARRRKGLTQAKVAELLGRPQSFVSKYETGERRLDVAEFLEVCHALSIEPEIILKRIGMGDG